jgi:Putative peptidoglycan binding domain
MGTTWVPGADRLTPNGGPGTCAVSYPPAAVWHTTEGKNYDAMHRVLVSKRAEPHILYDPTNDRMGQYFPLNVSARALRPGSGTSKNKSGVVVIQIEVCAYAATPFTGYWKPGPKMSALLQAIRSWNVPDVWPAGRLSQRGEGVSRNRHIWETKAGHFGHCNVPDNDHWDPGGIDTVALLGATTSGGTPPPQPPAPGGVSPPFPLPGGHYFGPKSGPPESHSGYYNNDDDKFRPWQAQMSARGWTIAVDGLYGPQTADVCRSFQAEKGLAVDGLIGPQTWSTAWTAPVT